MNDPLSVNKDAKQLVMSLQIFKRNDLLKSTVSVMIFLQMSLRVEDTMQDTVIIFESL